MNNTETLAKSYIEYKKMIDEAEKMLDNIKKQLLVDLANREEITAGDYTITNKQITRTTIDNKKLQAEYPRAAKACTKQSVYNRFVVKK